MAESTTDRISRLGSATSRALAFGVVFGIVLVVAGVLAVVGVDNVEVVATVLVAAVFGVGLFAGQRAGLFAAGLATLAYVALRRGDVEDAGAASFAMLVLARAVAYGVVSFAGARTRQLIDDVAPGGAGVDDRGLRNAPATVQSPVFVFDEEGRPEPTPVGAGQGAWQDGPPQGSWQGEPPYGDHGAPEFYAGSGEVPRVPAEAAYAYDDEMAAHAGGYDPVDPRSGGYEAVDPRSGGYEAVGPLSGGYDAVDPRSGYAAVDPRTGGYDAIDPRSGGYEAIAPRTGGYEAVDPRSGGYDAVDPRSGGYEAVDPRSGGYEAVDPRTGGYAAIEPHTGGYAAVDPRSGAYDAVDPRSGGYDAVDPRSGQFPPVDPRSGAYPAVDPRSGGYPAVQPGGGPEGGWGVDDGRGHVPGPAEGLGLTPSGRYDRVPDTGELPAGHWAGLPPHPSDAGPWSGQVPAVGSALAGAAAGAMEGASPVGPPAAPPIDPETRLWSARYLCERLATEQQSAAAHGDPFSLVLVQVPDGPLAALSYRRQVTLLRELGHQFVAGGAVDHLVHVPDQTQHWFAVVLPGADRHAAQQFERRLRDGVGGYLRSRGLLLSELESASLTSPDDDEAMGAIWEGLTARDDVPGSPELAFDY